MNQFYQTLTDNITSRNRVEAKKMLDRCNTAFFTGTDTSPLNDAEYDDCAALYAAVFGGETIQTAPRLDRSASTPHVYPQLANWLGKVHGETGLIEWAATTYVAPRGEPDAAKISSPKWDGLSLVVGYDALGYATSAITRGEDGRGVDVMRLFANEPRHFGLTFNVGTNFGVKYEACMTWEAVKRMSADTGKDYVDPRGAAAGIVNSCDPSRLKYLTLVPLDVAVDGDGELTRADRIGWITSVYASESDVGFTLNSRHGLETPVMFYASDTHDELKVAYDFIFDFARSGVYMIDGVVTEFIDPSVIEELGGHSVSDAAYITAVKFPSAIGHSVAISLDWDQGPTGRLTPVLNYTPVTIGGRTFNRTSLSNFRRFEELQLAPGTPVEIQIRGDVLAYVVRHGDNVEGAQLFAGPDGDVMYTEDESGRRVFAYTFASLAGRIERMLVKCGIKGFKAETIARITEAGCVTSLGGLWTIDVSGFSDIPGLGDGIGRNLKDALAARIKTKLFDWEVLASVGIVGVGRSVAKRALATLTLDDIKAMSEPSDVLIKAVGPINAQKIVAGVAINRADIEALSTVPGYVTSASTMIAYSGELHKVVVTGELVNFPVRDDFKTVIERMGHTMVGSVSKKTTLLITNDPDSPTVKNKKARELGVRVVDEATALDLLGVTVTAPVAAAQTFAPPSRTPIQEAELGEF